MGKRPRTGKFLAAVTLAGFVVGTALFAPIDCVIGTTDDFDGGESITDTTCTGIVPLVLPGYAHTAVELIPPNYTAALVAGALIAAVVFLVARTQLGSRGPHGPPVNADDRTIEGTGRD